MSSKVNLFASFKKEKDQQLKEQQQKEQQERREQQRQSGRKKEKTDSTAVKIKMGSGRRLVISFIISAAFFCICLVLLKNMTAEEEKVLLYVAVQELPENMQIEGTGGFAAKEVPLSFMPEGAVQDLQQIQGSFTAVDISRNQILTAGLFTDKEAENTDFEHPVEVSVGTSTLADVVGGVIRAGDLVNVSTVKQDGEEYTTESIVTNAYVTRTFTSGGIPVKSQDTEQPVTVINLIIDGSLEEAFNAALSQGTLRISRVVQ